MQSQYGSLILQCSSALRSANSRASARSLSELPDTSGTARGLITETFMPVIISQCVGNPGAAAKWQWCCGFYPGSRPGECTNCTAATFQDAREAFEAARRIFLERRTEADFQKWREHQAWTAEKYRRFDRGERMTTNGRPQCDL